MNLGSAGETESRRVIDTLNLENEYLYQLVVQRHAHECPVIFPVKCAMDATAMATDKQSVVSDKRLLAELGRLDNEIKTLKSFQGKQGVSAGMPLVGLSEESLRCLREQKALTEKLRRVEARLQSVTRVKNDLIRDRFVS